MRAKQKAGRKRDPLFENQSTHLCRGVARLLVSRMRMLMGFLRVLVSLLRVLVSFLVIALLMVFRRGVMRLGGVFVMLGCLAMCFVCHRSP
jgi:hypothetical protein